MHFLHRFFSTNIYEFEYEKKTYPGAACFMHDISGEL